MKKILLYGLQRTGTNYIEELMKKNFDNVSFIKNEYSRALPIHKHFRLYDEKYLIPQSKYLNCFVYSCFAEFDDHVTDIVGEENVNYIVVVKNPYSWYLSYKKHAKKSKFLYFNKGMCPSYILEFNAYYSKWLSLCEEAGGRINIVRYEDVVNDFENTMERIKQIFGFKQIGSKYSNIEKVKMSKGFDVKRLMYYKSGVYLDLISEKQMYVINKLLDQDVLDKLGYRMN